MREQYALVLVCCFGWRIPQFHRLPIQMTTVALLGNSRETLYFLGAHHTGEDTDMGTGQQTSETALLRTARDNREMPGPGWLERDTSPPTACTAAQGRAVVKCIILL